MSLSNLFKCTSEGDSSWFHLMVGTPNQLVSLKVRSQVTQRCPHRDCIGRQDRRIPSWAWSLLVGREMPCCTKVELFKEQTRDKVRRRFTLLVAARVGGTTGQAATGSGYGGGPGCCRCP